jgi:hypothetical protein
MADYATRLQNFNTNLSNTIDHARTIAQSAAQYHASLNDPSKDMYTKVTEGIDTGNDILGTSAQVYNEYKHSRVENWLAKKEILEFREGKTGRGQNGGIENAANENTASAEGSTKPAPPPLDDTDVNNAVENVVAPGVKTTIADSGVPETSFANVVNQAPAEAKAQGAVSQEPASASLAGDNPDLATIARTAARGLNQNSSLEDIQAAQKAVNDYGNSLPVEYRSQAKEDFKNILRAGNDEYEDNTGLVNLVGQKLSTISKYAQRAAQGIPAQAPKSLNIPDPDVPGPASVIRNDVLNGNPLSQADIEAGNLTRKGKGPAQQAQDVLNDISNQGEEGGNLALHISKGNVAQLAENLGAKLSPAEQLTQASQGKVPGLAQVTEAGDQIAQNAKDVVTKLVPDADQVADNVGNAVSQFGKLKNIASTASKVVGDGGEIADDVASGLLASAPEFGPAGAIVAGISGLIGLGTTIAGLFHKNKPAPEEPQEAPVPAPTLSIGANLSTTN